MPNKRFKPLASLSGTACRSPLTKSLANRFQLVGFLIEYISKIVPLLKASQVNKVCFTEGPPPLSGHVEIAVRQFH
jgi:hypothetical protein